MLCCCLIPPNSASAIRRRLIGVFYPWKYYRAERQLKRIAYIRGYLLALKKARIENRNNISNNVRNFNKLDEIEKSITSPELKCEEEHLAKVTSSIIILTRLIDELENYGCLLQTMLAVGDIAKIDAEAFGDAGKLSSTIDNLLIEIKRTESIFDPCKLTYPEHIKQIED